MEELKLIINQSELDIIFITETWWDKKRLLILKDTNVSVKNAIKKVEESVFMSALIEKYLGGKVSAWYAFVYLETFSMNANI